MPRPPARPPRKGPLQRRQETERADVVVPPASVPEQLGLPSLITVGITTIIAVATWFVLILGNPTDWPGFTIAFELTILLGNTVMAAIVHFTRGLLQKRTTGTTTVLFLIPIAASFLVFAATSAGVDPSGFDPDFNVIQIIGLLCLLALAAGLLGVAVYLMVVLPVIWLARAIVPAKVNDASSPTMGMGRVELAAGSVLFPAIILFGISMYFIAPNQGGGSTRERMGVQLATFFAGGGSLLPTIGVIGSIVLIIGAGVVYQRAYNARTKGRP